ncbi:uncharacterized protein [Arachis hypogaea]|uniref:uncharacterized protein isoform X3 n=1 Tax=Arachis hypogaea TaxID=3818 RepID=UPI000DEC7D5E|nr:uncharacterized protein LOC112756458 isoform X3 [Arachis hypogaea]
MNNDDVVLSIPLKKTDPVELYVPLRKLVASKYSESDAQKVESVLETLNKCRRDMVERRADLSLPMQRDCLIHYFKCLSMVEPLFTSISSDADPILFVWYDAFNPDHRDGVSSQRSAIQLEKAAVVFNLGAIYSQIAASCDRTTALGRHLAIEAFKVAANFFRRLWKVFAKHVVSATLDLTFLFAEFLHLLFSAQASELELHELLNKNDASYAFQQHRCALAFRSVYELYRRAYELMRTDSAARKHVDSFDQTWVTHVYQKVKFFEAEARQRHSSILPESEQPDVFSRVKSCALDHDAECVTEILVRRICKLSRRSKLGPSQVYIDLILSEYSPFKIMKDGKLVAYPWDMPPPYPTNSAILSSLMSSSYSDILAFLPLKKSEPLNLYESLRNYFVLKYSESVAKRVEGLLQMLHKLRNEMQRDDLSLPLRRDCLILYLKYLCMIEPIFPMNASPNPPIFVWYNAINPQQHSSQHNIHLEKASVLFNLGALCTHIALSCDQGTIQGYRLAIDALNNAAHWFDQLSVFESLNASGTIDLSEPYIDRVVEQFSGLKLKFCGLQPCGSSLPGYIALTYFPRTSELLAYDPSDVTEQFLLGYCKAHYLLERVCEATCLDLLSEVSPVKIEDGNLVANATLKAPNSALENMSLQETTLQCMFWCLGNSLNQLRRLLLANVLCGESMLPRLINNVILVFLCLIILCSLMISELSQYNPLDLFLGSKERIRKATKDLFITPQNNFRVFLNDVLILRGLGGGTRKTDSHMPQAFEERLKSVVDAHKGHCTENLFTLVAETMHKSRVLDQLLEVQKFDNFDIEGAIHAYYNMSNARDQQLL